MTDDDRSGRWLDPFDPQPPPWAMVRAEDIVKQIFDFEPGSGGRIRRRPTTPPVLRFTDSFVVGVLDLRAVEFPHLLEFVRCRFDSPPDLRQTKLNGCEFYECWLPGLEGHNIYSDNDVRLIGGTRVKGRLDLTDGEISGTLELTDCRLDNPGGYALHADRLQLDGALLAPQHRGERAAADSGRAHRRQHQPGRRQAAQPGLLRAGRQRRCRSAGTSSACRARSGRSPPPAGCTCRARGSTATSPCAARS